MARALIQDIEQDPNASTVLRATARWVRKYLCLPKPRQCVVANRRLPGGTFVAQAQFDAADSVAHVCPFMQLAADQRAVLLEEHVLTDPVAIEALVRSQIDEFKRTVPAHDPVPNRTPAAPPALNKTFINVFPYVRHAGGTCPEIQGVQQTLKVDFVENGLMLGDFFHGHPQPGLYNPAFQPLSSKYPMLAVRYLVEDDKLFNHGEPAIWAAHRRYFRGATPP